MKRKWLTIGIILVLVGIAVAPMIDFQVVKASTDGKLVEITTQACGIQGYPDTPVKLTREQYWNLEQYLVEFRARLNQTSTRKEAIPIFKEAIVELNKYGLLPKGMNVKQAQRLILGGNQNPRFYQALDMIQNLYREKADDFENYFCLIAGHTTVTITRGPILTILSLSFNNFYRDLQDWLSGYDNRLTMLFFSVVTLFLLPFYISLGIANSLSNLCPIMFLSTVGLSCWSPMGPDGIAIPWVYLATGWLHTNGLNGVKNWSGSILGNLSDDDRINLGMYEFYPGVLGFSGIKITLPFSNSFYIGYALKVKIKMEETT